MSYETSSGTLTEMIDALAAFALANSWTPRTPVEHRYWSVLGYSRDTILPSATQIDFIGMSNGGGNLITGGTASSSEGVANNALNDDGTLWSVSGQTETRWVYDFGVGNDIDLREITVHFGVSTACYQTFCWEFSDDGTTWETMKAFAPNVVSSGETFIGEWTDEVWPLSPDGGDNYIDITLDTTRPQATQYTPDGGTQPIDIFTIYIGVGRDRLAGLDGRGVSLTVPVDDVDEWHFFTDDTGPLYLHCAFKYTFEDQSYWHHFSVGQIDQFGMSHNGVVYATASAMLAFAETSDNALGTASGHHNLLCRAGYFQGSAGGTFADIQDSNVAYRFTQTGGAFPLPDDDEWPSRVDTHYAGELLAPTVLVAHGTRADVSQFVALNTRVGLPGSIGWMTLAHPTTGFQSMGTIPFILLNDDYENPDANWCMLGEYPDVRTIRIDSLGDATEITVGADTWMVFPLLRKVAVANSFGSAIYRVAMSGPAGIAYKKVV